MLMSLSKRYVFLAQKMAGAKAFESAYGAQCEIAVANDRGVGRHPVTDDSGRHDNYQAFIKTYGKFFDQFLPVDHFFVFGVARDPMRRLQTVYQRRTRSDWGNNRNSPRVESFAGFVESLAASGVGEASRISSQHAFFVDKNGAVAVNYLVRLEEMTSSLQVLQEYTGLDFSEALAVPNAPELSPMSADPGLRRIIEQSFPDDFELYENNTNRMLHEWNRSKRLDVEAALRWMAQAANRFEVAGSLLYKLRRRLQYDKDFSILGLNAMIDAWEPLDHYSEPQLSAEQAASAPGR